MKFPVKIRFRGDVQAKIYISSKDGYVRAAMVGKLNSLQKMANGGFGWQRSC